MIAGVNLIPMYHQAAHRRRAYAMRWVGICAGYTMLVMAAGFGAQCLWGRGAMDVSERLANLNASAASNESAAKAFGPKLEQMQTTLAASRTVGSQPDWSVLLRLVAGLLDHKTVLSSCRLKPAAEAGGRLVLGSEGKPKRFGAKGYVLDLNGLGENQQAVAGYVLRLEKTGLFGKVALIDTRKEPFLRGGQNAIGFQIHCTLDDGSEGEHG